MGNSVSHVFKSNESTFSSPVKINDSSTIEELSEMFKKLLEYHESLDKSLLFAMQRANGQAGQGGFTHPIESKQNIVEAFGENRGLRDNSEHIKNVQQLFDLGVLKVKINDNTSFKVEVHPHFSKIHKQLITNINTLLTTKPVDSEFSLNTVSDSNIRSQFQSNLNTINKVIARIMIYKYHIIFNNYIMHLYAIYAQSQIEVFEAQVVKKKKQSEFAALEKQLNSALSSANKSSEDVNIQTSLNALHGSLNASKAKFGGAAGKKHGGKKTRGGSQDMLATTQYIATVTSLLEEYKKMYIESNARSEEFFVFINRILDAKSQEIIDKYADMSTSTIINKNIISALKTLEDKINNNQIAKNSGSIDYFMSNLNLSAEEDGMLRQYLQMYSLQNNAAAFSQGLNSSI